MHTTSLENTNHIKGQSKLYPMKQPANISKGSLIEYPHG